MIFILKYTNGSTETATRMGSRDKRDGSSTPRCGAGKTGFGTKGQSGKSTAFCRPDPRDASGRNGCEG
jgi:hypothetical protein